MKLNILIKCSLVFCLVGISGTQVWAYTGIGSDWRDFYPDSCQDLQDATTSAQSCVLCHYTGFGLNPYGDDLKEAGMDFAAIESTDSDGDGRTNGEEINVDCTLPGDPASPVDQDSWGSLKALFR